jgi:hypothetical protein
MGHCQRQGSYREVEHEYTIRESPVVAITGNGDVF